MEIKNVLVTGDKGFIHRYQGLFQEMSFHFESVECQPSGDLNKVKSLDLLTRAYYKIVGRICPVTDSRFWKNERTFVTRSRQTERKIREMEDLPDLVFHIFCMYSPFWDKFDIPFVIYADYTMALARKNWWDWAPFNNDKEFASWIECERLAYERANHIFTMGNIAKTSLIEDYGIEPNKITAVGSSGHFQKPYEGEKTFGSQQILFNGSEWERKGGNLVLAAFKQVKKALPEAKLVIIGKKLNRHEDGVVNPGHISSRSEMENLFLKTDLVVAPARCDPFPGFLIEAMNCGVPCIVSASDGMPEIIDNGLNGIVIEQPTPELLANQITNLLGDIPLLTNMSQNARQKVKNKLNWSDIAKKISQVLYSLT